MDTEKRSETVAEVPLPSAPDYFSALPLDVVDLIYEYAFDRAIPFMPPHGPPSKAFVAVDRTWRFREIALCAWSILRQFIFTMDKQQHLTPFVKILVIELTIGRDTRSTLVRVVKSLRNIKHAEADQPETISVFLRRDVAQSLLALEELHLNGRLPSMQDPFDLSGHSALDQYSSLRCLELGDLFNANTANLLPTPLPRLPFALSQLTKIHLIGALGESPYLPPLLVALGPSTTAIELSSLSSSAHFSFTLSHLRHSSAVRHLFLEQLSEDIDGFTDVGTALASFVNLERLHLYGWFTFDPSFAVTLATSTSLRPLTFSGFPPIKTLLLLLEHPQRRSTLRLADFYTGRVPPCDPTLDELYKHLIVGGSTLPNSKLLPLAFSCDVWDDERSPQGVLDVLAAAKRVGVVVRGALFEAMGDEAEVEKRVAIVRGRLRELEEELELSEEEVEFD